MVGAAWGVTARKASHNASNTSGVTAGTIGRNSCPDNAQNLIDALMQELHATGVYHKEGIRSMPPRRQEWVNVIGETIVNTNL